MRISDWSSDVCSSDLAVVLHQQDADRPAVHDGTRNDRACVHHHHVDRVAVRRQRMRNEAVISGIAHGRVEEAVDIRSAERRVGKECVSTCRSRWSPYYIKKEIYIIIFNT